MKRTKSLSEKNLRLLTQNRLRNFWGYGNFRAPTWFVGMEEGLSNGAPYLVERFLATNDKAIVDMRHGMDKVVDHIRWFKPSAPIQATWKYPIWLYLYIKNGYAPSTEEIREHQTLRLGDSKLKETAAIELMPLPTTKTDEGAWIYGSLGIPGLSTRAEYLSTYKPERVRKLRDLFRTHQPKLAIFYSLTYLSDWKIVIDAKPKEITKGMHFAKANNTSCLVIPQGTAHGMKYARLQEFAEKVLKLISSPSPTNL